MRASALDSNFSQLFKEGQAAYNAKNYQGAIGKLSAALATFPVSDNSAERAECFLWLGWSQLRDHKSVDALSSLKAFRNCTEVPQNKQLTAGKAFSQLVDALRDQGNYTAAEDAVEQGFDVFNHLDDQRKVKSELIILESKKGLLLKSQKKYSEAEAIYEKLVPAAKVEFGIDSIQTATFIQDEASILSALGRDSESVPLFESALTIYKTKNAPSVNLAIVTSNFAFCLSKLGRNSDSEENYKKALEYWDACTPSNDSQTIALSKTLASLYRKDLRPKDACVLLQDALDKVKGKIDLQNSDLISAINLLADCFADQKDYAQTDRVLGDAIDELSRLSTPLSPELKSSIAKRYYAWIEVWRARGERDRQRAVAEKLMLFIKSNYQPASTEYSLASFALASCVIDAGDVKLGRFDLQKLIDDPKSKDKNIKAASLYGLAISSVKDGMYDNAEDCLKKVLALEPSDDLKIKTLVELISLLHDRSRYEACLPLRNQLIELSRDDLQKANAMEVQAQDLHALQKFDLAEIAAQKALDFRKQRLGSDLLGVVRAKAFLGVELAAAGKFSEGESLLRDTVSTCESVPELKEKLLLFCYHQLAFCFQKEKKTDRAIELYERVLKSGCTKYSTSSGQSGESGKHPIQPRHSFTKQTATITGHKSY